ncbi:MAG TPA: hypothetical protein VJM50_18985 [Pyrinomonadaceae bacterium]|nr:hypothetical protein [Pyrinomonadaceae bacterium]
MSTRQEIIVKALRQRYAEVCKSASQPAPNVFGELTGFVSDLRKQLFAGLDGRHFRKWTAPKTWFQSSCESLAAIRTLALDEEIECIDVEPPVSTFFDDLHAASRDPYQRFQLLTMRYRHPLNIAAPSEDKVREHLLERLMVSDRASLEQDSLHLVNADDLLLKLNFIAISASLSHDLRYLDALNYYYELLPSAWYPQSPQSWLRVSFLMFYVRALAFHSN